MDALPAPKFQQRQWRFTRKRRRSNEAGDSEGNFERYNPYVNLAITIINPSTATADGKMVKKDGDSTKMDVETPTK